MRQSQYLEPKYILDLLDFVEENIREAVDAPAVQFAAVTEAGCAMPVLRDRLREDEPKWTIFVLVMGNQIEPGHWRKWWSDLAEASHEKILRKRRCSSGNYHRCGVQ
jgi:hypothetical protein